MPSQQEWQAVHETFERMYVKQGRTLADVSDILAKDGFHATVKQYKTQITRWRLRKNSKHSDMVFAKKRLMERKNSGHDTHDTTFIMHGQPKKSSDVARYWNRTQKSLSIQTDMDPKTPPGVEYYDSPTISPMSFSDLTLSPVSMLESPQEADFEADDDVEEMVTNTTPTSMMSFDSISMPDFFQDIFVAVRHATDHFNMCEMLYDFQQPNDLSPSVRQNRLLPIHKFVSRAMKLKLTAEYGIIPASTQVAMDECKQLVAVILAEHDPRFLIFLFRILTEFAEKGIMKQARAFLNMIKESIKSTKNTSHPVLALAEALLRSPDLIPDIAERILQSRFTELSTKLGPEHPQTFSVGVNLASVYASNQNWYDYHKVTMDAYNNFVARPAELMFQSRRIGLIAFETEVIRAEYEIGNCDAAIRRAEEALLYCERHPSDEQTRVTSQCSVLVTLADAQAKRSTAESKVSYERAFQAAKGVLPLDNHWYLRAAIGLRKIEGSQLLLT